MAFCFQCGALIHNDDMLSHVCLEEDKPKKGQPIKFSKKV